MSKATAYRLIDRGLLTAAQAAWLHGHTRRERGRLRRQLEVRHWRAAGAAEARQEIQLIGFGRCSCRAMALPIDATARGSAGRSRGDCLSDRFRQRDDCFKAQVAAAVHERTTMEDIRSSGFVRNSSLTTNAHSAGSSNRRGPAQLRVRFRIADDPHRREREAIGRFVGACWNCIALVSGSRPGASGPAMVALRLRVAA